MVKFRSLFSQFHLYSYGQLLKITVLHLQNVFSRRWERVFSSNLLWQTGLCIWSMDNKAGYYFDSGKCLRGFHQVAPQNPRGLFKKNRSRNHIWISSIALKTWAIDPAYSKYYYQHPRTPPNSSYTSSYDSFSETPKVLGGPIIIYATPCSTGTYHS